MEKSIKSIGYNYGMYLAIISIVILLIMYALDIEKNWIISAISFVATVTIFVLGIKAYKYGNVNVLSLGDAIKAGLAIAAVGGIISAIYVYIHYSFVQPEFIDGIREEALKQAYERNPNMTNEQLESASGMMNMFTSPFFMGTMSLIGTLFIGLIVSLIAGLIMKSDEA